MMGAVSMKFHREILRDAQELCRAAGGDCWLENGTGRHGKLIIVVNGLRRMTPVSSSPRNPSETVAMKLCDVRRLLRDMQRPR